MEKKNHNGDLEAVSLGTGIFHVDKMYLMIEVHAIAFILCFQNPAFAFRCLVSSPTSNNTQHLMLAVWHSGEKCCINSLIFG